MTVSITFLGAAGTVTGSKYLVEGDGKRILIDAGLFQGERSWRERNWENPPVDLATVDATLITHAHIDHIGILPRFVKFGLRSPVFATHSTIALSALLLRDSAHLQEEEAEYRARTKRSRHDPPLPLYTTKDAEDALALFKEVPFHAPIEILPGVTATWYWAGHILGAASIVLSIGGKRITFSGDIGRYGVPVLRDPETPPFGDLLLIESTYGDRLHKQGDPRGELGTIVRETVAAGGALVIPCFAVGRCQELLYDLRELKSRGEIPDIPVIVDSPMADDATALYSDAAHEYDEESLAILRAGAKPFSLPKLGFTKSREDSIRLNGIDQPMVLMSASGMLSGGRILHHLRHRLPSPKNTVLFVGFQPAGGRGAWIKSGAPTVRIFGEEVPIRARIAEISAFSAHADRNDLLRWCKAGSGRPGSVAVVHGEPESAARFAETLREELHWGATPARYLEKRLV